MIKTKIARCPVCLRYFTKITNASSVRQLHCGKRGRKVVTCSKSCSRFYAKNFKKFHPQYAKKNKEASKKHYQKLKELKFKMKQIYCSGCNKDLGVLPTPICSKEMFCRGCFRDLTKDEIKPLVNPEEVKQERRFNLEGEIIEVDTEWTKETKQEILELS